MASVLARRATLTTCRRTILVNASRQLHSNSQAQNSWLMRLLRGKKQSESTEETKKFKSSEEIKSSSIKEANLPSTNASMVSTSTSDVADTTPRQRIKRTPLTPARKDRRFQAHMEFITPRLGRRPTIELPLIKKATWLRTLALCQTEEQLQKVMEMMPLWHDMGNKFDEQFSEAFVRRCLYLKNPTIALDVFGDYGKYDLRLTLTGARELLNATYDTQPLSFVITLTSLFDAHGLPHFTEDLPCCAMVIAACLKDNGEHAQTIETALYPYLKGAARAAAGQVPEQASPLADLPKKWTSVAMWKIHQRLPKTNMDLKMKRLKRWLRDWREKNGFVPATTIDSA